ncbi:MAG: GAF domain-containing protein [Chloroflexota bacterium]|nr:GAF domain-containing protein [Chloroflexota bacterium]
MKWLIEIEGDRIIRQIPLKKSEYTLGRGQENDIVFGNRKVSRLHALLVREGDAYYAIDKDSVNGVFVNGERVKRRRITCGDEIKLSTEVTLFYLSDGAAEDEKVVQMMNRIWEAIIKKDFLRLKEVTSRIISLDSLDHILNIILEEVITLVGAERGFIALTDDDGEIQTDTSVSHNIPLGEDSVRKSVFSHSTVRRAIANKENVFILNTEDSEADPSKSVVELQIMSIMCSPLLFGDRTVGILYVDSGYQMSDFNEMDRFFFTILADHAAISVQVKLFTFSR